MKTKLLLLSFLLSVFQLTIAQDSGQSGSTLEKSKVLKVNDVEFTMILVEGGAYHMTDSYTVTLDTYYIGQTEVTQELWEAVMKSNPSEDASPKHPVENVSWNNCQKFIKKLNKLTGLNFRLPTEAEWMYAAIGGKNSAGFGYSGSNNLEEVGWYRDSRAAYIEGSAKKGNQTVLAGAIRSQRVHDVAKKLPNELGIYDMSGNVSEWCQDWYVAKLPNKSRVNPSGPDTGSVRVIHGGGFKSADEVCTIAFRSNSHPSFKFDDLGLRLVLVP